MAEKTLNEFIGRARKTQSETDDGIGLSDRSQRISEAAHASILIDALNAYPIWKRIRILANAIRICTQHQRILNESIARGK